MNDDRYTERFRTTLNSDREGEGSLEGDRSVKGEGSLTAHDRRQSRICNGAGSATEMIL
ncbi:hypothetical protein TSUD_99950 [Trifolium subterraneum]|uniref:Uncharacterized protein n=1 Tax=Trifolium subterraneum TaxID=3900 RepID=A0A2Z6NT21_TRISU|nr:hypothetical protein TSUD_99950 [Trifolium subterraneum]